VCHLGNNAVGVASGASIVHVVEGVDVGGVGDDAVSIANGFQLNDDSPALWETYIFKLDKWTSEGQ